MASVMEKLKSKNIETTTKPKRTLLGIELILVIIAIILLIVDSNTFESIAVLMIFFSIVLGIISLFLYLLNVSKNIQKKIKNSIDIVYQDSVDNLNFEKGTDYQIKSDVESDENWILFPKFANKSIHYLLKNETIKMYHAEAFNKVGAEQKRTYYFKGLYIVMNGVKGDFQYRDKELITDKLISSLKGLYGSDENDIKLYNNKTKFASGNIYINEDKSGLTLVEELLQKLRLPFITSLRIGAKNNQLHIAITQQSMRLPYVKKYNQEEIECIKRILSENISLLEKIQEIVSEFDD